MSDRLRKAALPAIVIAVAVALRLYGISWGLPLVFEEATPLRKAWGMWGWGERYDFDLNPHFFNYPSLMIYVHFVAQAVTYAAMKLLGVIDTSLDFRARYILDATPFFIIGRLVTVSFATATVATVFALGRRIDGRWVGALAAGLLAVCAFHINKSQMIEVDVPLAFFVTLTLFLAMRLTEAPTRKDVILTGLSLGLAVSSKYPGALLGVVVVIAFWLGRRDVSRERDRGRGRKKARGRKRGSAGGATRAGNAPGWGGLALLFAVAAGAFVVTSPYVLLDFPTFWEHLALERQHMRLGHFGGGGTSSWVYYARALAGGVAGWAVVGFALAGVVYLAGIRRRKWAIVLSGYVVLHLLVVGSWSMQAPRYVLPLTPVLMILAAAMLAELARIAPLRNGSPAVRTGAIAVGAVVLAAPLLAALPEQFERSRPDPRTQATAWIEANVPAGSFVVTELYGPELFGPHVDWPLDPDLRQRVLAARAQTPYYAVQRMPMYQVNAERSAVFYDIAFFEVADVVVTTGAVRSRYAANPKRFARQNQFYEQLEARFTKAAEFVASRAEASTITVYTNPRHDRPFAERNEVAVPGAPESGLAVAPGGQERFYFSFGVNYEAFGFDAEAYACYENALRFAAPRPYLLVDVSMGIARTLTAMGRRTEALSFLQRAEGLTNNPAEKATLRQFRASVASGHR